MEEEGRGAAQGVANGAGDRGEAVAAAARELARERHEGAGPSHDFSHVERVHALATRIAAASGADPLVVSVAAWLHDIGRVRESVQGEECDRHEELSAELARPFLEASGLGGAFVEAVLHAIVHHRHRRGRSPESLEARCLFDADKLDSLGAVGAARAYLWLGEHGRSVWYPPESWSQVPPTNNATEVDSFQREWEIKFRGLKERMFTEEGRRIARERHDRMATILAWIEEEVRGLS